MPVDLLLWLLAALAETSLTTAAGTSLATSRLIAVVCPLVGSDLEPAEEIFLLLFPDLATASLEVA